MLNIGQSSHIDYDKYNIEFIINHQNIKYNLSKKSLKYDDKDFLLPFYGIKNNKNTVIKQEYISNDIQKVINDYIKKNDEIDSKKKDLSPDKLTIEKKQDSIIDGSIIEDEEDLSADDEDLIIKYYPIVIIENKVQKFNKNQVHSYQDLSQYFRLIVNTEYDLFLEKDLSQAIGPYVHACITQTQQQFDAYQKQFPEKGIDEFINDTNKWLNDNQGKNVEDYIKSINQFNNYLKTILVIGGLIIAGLSIIYFMKKKKKDIT